MYFLPCATFVENRSNRSSGAQIPWDTFVLFLSVTCTLLSEIEYIYSCMNKKSNKNNKFKRWKIRYLINLFLQQFNFIVKFINIVEECKVFIFHFNEFSYQPIDVIYTCGFFYGLKSFLVRLKNRDKKSQITWCINKPVQSFPQ